MCAFNIDGNNNYKLFMLYSPHGENVTFKSNWCEILETIYVLYYPKTFWRFL